MAEAFQELATGKRQFSLIIHKQDSLRSFSRTHGRRLQHLLLLRLGNRSKLTQIERQADNKTSSLANPGFTRHGSAMTLHNPLDDCQS
jgi:hypothetical protein